MKLTFKISLKKSNNFSITNKVMLITIITILTSISLPKTTNAGLFSFLSSLTSDTASAEVLNNSNASNSQNMPILKAPVNIDPNPNKIDGEIIISDNTLIAKIGPSGTDTDIDTKENSMQISLYTVHEGDTLSEIADMFGVTANTIIWANDLSRNSVLRKDQKLIILPISGIQYTVKKGDTIMSIVSKYKSDISEVLQFNDLTTSSVLGIGDIIVIPDAEPSVSTSNSTSKIIKAPVNKAHDTNGTYYPGYYIRPIDIGYESQSIHGYNAVDLAASIGTPIHASAAGTVIAVTNSGSWNGGYGNYVIISHKNGSQTLYAHTLKNFVSVGDHVEQGQMIAKIGMTGKTTGPHVHFEIRGAKNPF